MLTYFPKATHELLVRVKDAVKKLKTERGSEIHIVPGTTGGIDQQGARGYLLGAVLGRRLLSRKEAAGAGLNARNKLTAIEKRLAAEKETARRAAGAARKAGGNAVEKQAAEAKIAREAVEREQIALDLPQRVSPSPDSKLIYQACVRTFYSVHLYIIVLCQMIISLMDAEFLIRSKVVCSS